MNKTDTDCKYCNGNDKNVPCAYPSQKKDGCLRDVRLKEEAEERARITEYYLTMST